MGELLRADPTMMDNSTFIHSLRRKAASEKKGMCYTQVSAEDHSEPHLQAALPRAYPAEKDGATPQNGRGHGVVHVACLNAFDDLLHHRQPGSLSDEVSRGRKNLQKRARPQLVDLHRVFDSGCASDGKRKEPAGVPEMFLQLPRPSSQFAKAKAIHENDIHVNDGELRFNLASTWIGAILPHVLAKIDRVSYGLLSKKQLEAADEKTPFSRLVMAVPFVGKDVPSRSSEFAHPDVAIGLTILAYRFEGLRPSDVRSIVAQLKQDGARQLGPRDTRPAHVLFESWVRQAGCCRGYKMRRLDEELSRNILPLSLFQPTDPKQMARLYRQIQNTSEVAHFWLRQHVFPVTMNFHPLKISASGHELGSSLLFGYRLGFSGTPSNLLPEDLGECFYEPGSDGQVTAVLTDPKVTSAEVCEPDWSPLKLLERVAQGQFHALIDTGALITNMDNEQVARELLAKLPPQDFDGVVFLDPSDRKMILLRGSSSTGAARAVSLVTSGVVPERRFTFFDQVHTTGMDILAAPCAKAVLTVGKDMNFRDYAQGAFRMRKVGKGQCIHLLVIPEVQTRIVAELGGSGQLILDVPKWLLLNSCRSESLQSLKLLAQELSNGWRKQALQHLCSDVIAHEKMPPAQRMRRFCSAEPLRACLRPFQDQISFKVEDQIIAPRSYRDTMKQQCDEHWPFSQEDLARQTVLLERIAAESQVAEHQEMHQGFAAEVVHEQEQEQQQEQEEEQEEEQENAFTRDDEQANPWRAQVLSDAPKEEGEGERPFYRLCHFRARPEQPQLPLDDELWLSDNFFRPSWVGLGERRLKTASVLLEWHPEISQARQKRGMQKRVRRIFEELQQTGVAPTEAAMKALMKAKESIRTEPLTPEELAGSDEGHRYLVLVTLAEAETLRWLARSSSSSSSPLRDVGFALRSLGGRPLEASAGFVRGEEKIDRLLSLVRLFNCEMFFTKVELETLEAQLHEVPLHLRQNWFEELLRLRRRRARFLWLDTPVAKLFTPQEEWKSLRAQSLRCALQRALRHFAGPLEDLEALLRPMSPDALGQHLLRLRQG
ncbi:unnamed protein product [Durusdinium trenchii]|uniref:ubiquitinyl hydrolase 1 n=1 Tax=Durusdinium trenchii TaxID=1381693 RepID=A0ABP0KCU6_9DINO